ncbi:putative Methyl-CpG-binding domain-containing protein [Helianthus annuus]|nr:putative Methyl-CpG-binding domain-containing protein [Helianthus annuus]
MSPVKSPEQHSVRDVGKTNKFVVGNDEADELPPGWTKELKTRKSGSRTKVDRRYTDPVTGYIFHSLKDAQRYVKTGEVGSLATKPKNNECVDTDNKDERLHMEEKEERSESKEQHSARDVGKTNKIVAENDEADELPPGWTMELKKRKPGSKTKFDRRYTDPVTGYIFISLKDAQRYVKTGVLGRLARKPKNNEDEKLHIEERSKSKDSETLRRKRPLDNTGTEFSETGKSELIHRASKRLAAPSPPPVSKTRQAAHQSGIEIDSPTSLRDSKTRHATPLVGTEVPSPPPQPEPKTQQAKHLYSIVDNASPASLPPAKTRRATRQAGIEINAPPPSLPDTRTGRQATRARLVNLASPKKTDKKTEAEKMTDKHNQENHGNPKEHNNKIEMGPATLPPVYFEKKELPAVNATVSNPMPQSGYGYGGNMKSSDSSINFSMNDLWTDPCIEFAVKTLTGAIPCEDLNKPENPAPSPLKVPLEDLWTDPCIEFAVKTLTGAIPVGENDRLQQRTDTSRNTRAPHDFYLPDVGPAGQNKQQQQQQQGSTYGNVGFQNSGNFANGQCSRYRFF